jgi:hypothetical protein
MKPEMKVMMFLLLIFVAGACSESKEPVDMDGKDASMIVTEDISGMLTDLPSHLKGIIIESEQSVIQTPEDYFQEIAKKHIADDATLYPQLTYRIKYRKTGFLKIEEVQCDAMAYSVIREGKLYGDGLVLSQSVGWNIHATGYSEKGLPYSFYMGMQTGIYVVAILLLYFAYKRFSSGRFVAKAGKARIVRIACVDTGYGGFTLSSVRGNKSMYSGNLLRIAVGRGSLFDPLASSVDIGFVYIDNNGIIQYATGHIDLDKKTSIGIGELYFPSRPYTKKFICKVWVMAAYYANGDIWKNVYADKEKEKAKRYITKKREGLNL